RRLLQVLSNLVANAVKFTPRTGTVTISADSREAHVEFAVRNTGIGIPADQLANIFDRFWQAPESRRSGAGLGLAIVKGLVEAHGGRVLVESEPGRGSVFRFAVSAVSESTPAAHRKSN